MNNENERPQYYWKVFFLFVGLYLISLLTYYPVLLNQVEIFIGLLGDSFNSTASEFALVALVNPLLLGIILIYFGTRYFHRVNLRSLMAEKVEKDLPDVEREKHTLKESIPYILFVSFIMMILLLGFDVVFQNGLPEAYQPSFGIPNVAQFLSEIFYSGLAQELLLRFGVMSTLVYVLSGRGANLTESTYIVSIIFTSLLYAFAQYSSVITSPDMSFVLLLRILLLDGLAGILYGYLFYRFHIEAAMMSHMLTNLLVVLGNIVLVVSVG